MTTHSTAGSPAHSIDNSRDQYTSDTTSEDQNSASPDQTNQPDNHSNDEPHLAPQLEALADIWDALQSLPEQETSPTEYLETADTRSKLENQLQNRLTRLGAELFEQFLDARRGDDWSTASLELLAELDTAIGAETRPTPDPDLDTLLPELHQAITTAPSSLENTEALERELRNLRELLAPDRLKSYAALPDDLHRAMLTVVVSRMRHVQTYRDRSIAAPLELDDAISELFRTLGRHLNRFDPGYIRGMKLEHDPYTDSWVADITHWSSRLGALCNEYLSTPLGHQSDNADTPLTSAPSTSKHPDNLDAHSALNSIEQSLADDTTDTDDLRDIVATYLDRGLNASHPRLLDILAPHAHLFTADRFQPLQHAFSAVD